MRYSNMGNELEIKEKIISKMNTNVEETQDWIKTKIIPVLIIYWCLVNHPQL